MKNYRVTSCHLVFEDNYNDGEQAECINSYTMQSFELATSPKEAIVSFLKGYLCFDINFNDCEVSERGTHVYTSVTVDTDNLEPTKQKIELWKRGKVKLFTNRIVLNVDLIKPVKL